MNAVNCDRCGGECVPTGVTTGYGVTADGQKHCFPCCGEVDRAEMIATGRATLYLSGEHISAFVSNWPGTLKFYVQHVSRGRHNIARVRYDFRFTGPDGKEWSGTQYGDDTQIAHCRRLK